MNKKEEEAYIKNVEKAYKEVGKEMRNLTILFIISSVISGIFTYLISLKIDITQYWFAIWVLPIMPIFLVIYFTGMYYTYKTYDKEWLYKIRYEGAKDVWNEREKLEKRFPNV